MAEIYLGELERIVLLAVMRLGEDAYAVPILDEIGRQTGRQVARGALYTALDRLETKGCLRSRLGQPLAGSGGGGRRRVFVTPPAPPPRRGPRPPAATFPSPPPPSVRSRSRGSR